MGAARPFCQLLGRERGDLYSEQATGYEVFARVAQERQRVVQALQAQERVEGADGQCVTAFRIYDPHVSRDPFDGLAFLSASFVHRLRDLYGGYVVAGGERDGETARARAPLDYRSGLAVGEGMPEWEVVV